jgi:hypothetical protein
LCDVVITVARHQSLAGFVDDWMDAWMQLFAFHLLPYGVGKRCLEASLSQIGIRDGRAPGVVRCGIRICGLAERNGLKTAEADKGCGRDVDCTMRVPNFRGRHNFSISRGISSGPRNFFQLKSGRNFKLESPAS